MEIWINLFINSFTANILFAPNSESVLYGFAAFHHPSLWPALVVSSVGATCGQMCNFFVGWLIVCFKDKKWFVLDDEHYAKLQRIARRFGLWILLFQHLPLYSLFPVIVGFFRAKPLLAAILIFIGVLIHDATGVMNVVRVMGGV